MVEDLEYFVSSDMECEQSAAGLFQTARVETETMPPLMDMGRKLQAFARDGNTEGVKELMAQGAPFTTDWLGLSALHMACQKNHYDTAEVLLKAGISRDARNKVDRTPLHVAAQEGHIAIMGLLLAYGVDVDASDMLRMTPLHWASEYGHKECVKLLLEHGADATAINKFDKTADQIAFDNNRVDITALIQDYAEDPMHTVRRNAARERLLQATSAQKMALEVEKHNKNMNARIDKVMEKMEKSNKEGDVKEVRVIKIPKRKLQQKIVLGNSSKLSNSVQPPDSVDPPTNSVPLNHINSVNQVTSDFPHMEDLNESTEKTLAMLQAHGITMLPNDESTIVASAVKSGQKVVLTEAGKLALNLTEKQPIVMKTSSGKGIVKMPLPDLLKGKKVITIRADQLINMKNERKVIIQTDKKLKPSIFGNAMPRLEVPLQQSATLPQTNPLQQLHPFPQPHPLPQSKHKVEVVVTKSIVNNKPQLRSTIIQKPVEEEESEVAKIRQEMEQMKKQLKLLTEKYLKKEKEAEEYKMVVNMLQKN
uniref:Uncharacterized protein n=1 Tax=Homalodisca liturata TaxID=320908 RepID=A0A1B6IV72_9HEMI